MALHFPASTGDDMSIHTDTAPILRHEVRTNSYHGHGSWVNEAEYQLCVWHADGDWARIYAHGYGQVFHVEAYMGTREDGVGHTSMLGVEGHWTGAREACQDVATTIFPGLAIRKGGI